ncbi:MAG: YhfC family intramembrane metalloprotease [Chloroflexaceae bacterium]
MQTLPEISTAWLVTSVIATLFNIIFPIVLAIWLTRRMGEKFKFVLYGALIFLVFQLLTRVPLVTLLGQQFGATIRQSDTLRWLWLGGLALTAGLFEEIGRYVGYRRLMRNDARNWRQGVLYGVGHGGFEAAVFVGILGVLGLINVIVLTQLDLATLGLSAEQQQQIAGQLQTVAEQPGWFPLLAAWERLWSMAFHVGLSLLVLQVFWRKQWRWLWLAIAAHAGVNFIAAGVIPLLDASMLWAELVIMLAGLLGLWLIFALRRAEPDGEQKREVPTTGEVQM